MFGTVTIMLGIGPHSSYYDTETMLTLPSKKNTFALTAHFHGQWRWRWPRPLGPLALGLYMLSLNPSLFITIKCLVWPAKRVWYRCLSTQFWIFQEQFLNVSSVPNFSRFTRLVVMLYSTTTKNVWSEGDWGLKVICSWISVPHDTTCRQAFWVQR